MRMCVDYRLLDDHTIKNKFPLPRIEGILKSLQSTRYFSKLDLMSRDTNSSRGLMEERFYDEIWTLSGGTLMPLCLTNSPATFQATMNKILRPLLNKWQYTWTIA